ncbi:carboxypeptidase-like regulatory domain-containing protein [Psychroserpens sp. Hel_I_66]|uniref:carboxypeptidase-like regulatory domain-containing protein n=1 Tax=Psychroserpens sp. Hel_I_66 TaxID=1250004 RepID=UPI0006471A1C|nr:carboxypeptidase-like regulatory domain-containing protein [Psychroserpens sp. Hel_I_66]
MRTALNINIPEPCHEDWQKMTPQDQGRHCSSCEKTVFDFTTKTDEQIVKTFLNEGKVCGRFKSTQLNRELVLNRKEKNNYLSYVASTLFAFLSFGTQDVEAQGEPKIIQRDTLQKQTINGKSAISILNKKILHGTIFNSQKSTIQNSRITIKETGFTTLSYNDGKFTIKAELGNTIIIENEDYETLEVVIDNFSKKNIYLKIKALKNPLLTGITSPTEIGKIKIISNPEKISDIPFNEKQIEGTIISKTDGLPLPGVSVVNLRTQAATQTDFDGNFTINAVNGDELIFGFLGMKNFRKTLDENIYYKLEMNEDPGDCGENLIYAGYPDYTKMNKCLRQKARKEKRKKIKNGELERFTTGKLLYNISNIFRRKD